jgi:DNA-binding protein YbaB
MFDKLKAMGAAASLLRDRDRLKAAGERLKRGAVDVRATGEAGGGAVRVTANGRLRIVAIDMTPALIAGMAADERTRRLAGSLIADAVNDALDKAQEQMQAQIAREAEDLGLGSLAADLGGFLS